MTDQEVIAVLKAKEGLIIRSAGKEWIALGASQVSALGHEPSEFWFSEPYMVETYAGDLADGQYQLLELSGEEITYEFESWKRAMLPTLQDGPLRARIVEHRRIKHWITRFRIPLAITDQINSREDIKVALHPVNLDDFNLKTNSKRILFRKDGSFKIMSGS